MPNLYKLWTVQKINNIKFIFSNKVVKLTGKVEEHIFLFISNKYHPILKNSQLSKVQNEDTNFIFVPTPLLLQIVFSAFVVQYMIHYFYVPLCRTLLVTPVFLLPQGPIGLTGDLGQQGEAGPNVSALPFYSSSFPF